MMESLHYRFSCRDSFTVSSDPQMTMTKKIGTINQGTKVSAATALALAVLLTKMLM
jgi:hypothetical protein